MLDVLREFFGALLQPGAQSGPEPAVHTLQLATAVMLVEVMRADASFHPGEREAVLAALREKFGLSQQEAAHLAELGEVRAREATDLFAFTSLINERFDMPQKLRMVELMWQVAYADGHLSEHERHVMWRLADLLHIPQGAYQHARLRARDAWSQSGGSTAPVGERDPGDEPR